MPPIPSRPGPAGTTSAWYVRPRVQGLLPLVKGTEAAAQDVAASPNEAGRSLLERIEELLSRTRLDDLPGGNPCSAKCASNQRAPFIDASEPEARETRTCHYRREARGTTSEGPAQVPEARADLPVAQCGRRCARRRPHRGCYFKGRGSQLPAICFRDMTLSSGSSDPCRDGTSGRSDS